MTGLTACSFFISFFIFSPHYPRGASFASAAIGIKIVTGLNQFSAILNVTLRYIEYANDTFRSSLFTSSERRWYVPFV